MGKPPDSSKVPTPKKVVSDAKQNAQPTQQNSRTGGCVKRRHACSARADLFGDGALGHELQLELAGQIQLFNIAVFAHEGGDEPLDLAVAQQEAHAKVGHAAVVGHDGQISRSLGGSEQRDAQRNKEKRQDEPTFSTRPARRFSAIPHSPKPPLRTVEPSATTRQRRKREKRDGDSLLLATPLRASLADGYTLVEKRRASKALIISLKNATDGGT